MEFVCDRSTLLTGAALKAFSPYGSGVLYDPKSECACVLGQYLMAVGASKDHLKGKGDPSDVRPLPVEAGWLVEQVPGRESKQNTDVANDIVAANDNWDMHQIRREAKLKKLFAKEGITLSFVGRYADATSKVKRAYRQN